MPLLGHSLRYVLGRAAVHTACPHSRALRAPGSAAATRAYCLLHERPPLNHFVHSWPVHYGGFVLEDLIVEPCECNASVKMGDEWKNWKGTAGGWDGSWGEQHWDKKDDGRWKSQEDVERNVGGWPESPAKQTPSAQVEPYSPQITQDDKASGVQLSSSSAKWSTITQVPGREHSQQGSGSPVRPPMPSQDPPKATLPDVTTARASKLLWGQPSTPCASYTAIAANTAQEGKGIGHWE